MKLLTAHGSPLHEDACTAWIWHWGYLRIAGGWVRISHVVDSSLEEKWTAWEVRPCKAPAEA